MKNINTLGIYIGRFRPLHNAHLHTIKKALKNHTKVLVFVGSCGKPRDIENPFNFKEISIMIESCLTKEEIEKITIIPLLDYSYSNTKWITQTQKYANQVIEEFDIDVNSIYLHGCEKDKTSFYLKFFPQWKFVSSENITNLNATDIRKAYFEDDIGDDMLIKSKVPQNVYNFLNAFKKTKEYDNLKNEYIFIKNYKKSWENAPYQPTFVTTDAIVECNGHILLIKRKAIPGKGLWALPGGFININETIEESMIRELKEETKIDVSKNILKGNILKKEVFDNPNRSLRGRTITHGFYINLPQTTLPQVFGDDDAIDAKWFPLSIVETMENIIFEDHLDIISHFTGINKEYQY